METQTFPQQTTPTTFTPRPSNAITCTRCGQADTVPFTPTPGRPILCGGCHRKARERRRAAPRIPLPPPRRMLNMKRKGHFVYDALEALDARGELEEHQQRAFVEMVFARGSRRSTRDAIEFIEEKTDEGALAPLEAQRLSEIVNQYSKKR